MLYGLRIAALIDKTAPSIIEELRLTRFKSFKDAVLPLDDLTVLIGRNGTGKSNAIEALEALAILASGDDLRDAIDGTRLTEAGIRGGSAGCPPYGETSFALGCTVRRGKTLFRFDVEIETEGIVQIMSERLVVAGTGRNLLCTEAVRGEGLGQIRASYSNGRRGKNPVTEFRADRLLVSQVPLRIPTGTDGLDEVHDAAATVVEALQAVSVIDPVPQLMRSYVPERDNEMLRRQGENLSAVVARLRGDPQVWEPFRSLVSSLPEQRITSITVERSKFGDVIIALKEKRGRSSHLVPAKQMSDGMLRFIAFAAALLEAPVTAPGSSAAQVTLVIEEIENGLHPSRARELVGLIRDESHRRDVRALVTTHSPALLNALGADDHKNVVLCDRDAATGSSRLRRLIDLPEYPRAMARGTLGQAVTENRLVETSSRQADRDFRDLLSEL